MILAKYANLVQQLHKIKTKHLCKQQKINLQGQHNASQQQKLANNANEQQKVQMANVASTEEINH
jgi:hypothetical protein